MEAHPGRNPPGLRPSPNTPSDVSCSSGPCSVVSTRETSPASSTHHPLETSSAARDLSISCPDHAAAAELPSPGRDLSRPRPDMSRPRPGLRAEFPSPLEMNPNPFQPVNDRRSKLAVEIPRASHTSPTTTSEGNIVGHRQHTTPFRRTIAPIAPPHPSSALPPSSTIHRGLCITNWRSSTTSLDGLIAPSPTTPSTATSCASRDTSTRTHTAASSSNLLRSPAANIDSRSNHKFLGHNNYASIAGLSSSRPSSAYHHDIHHFDHQKSDRDTAKMHPQTGKIIADSDMDRAMCYCYDRGGGQYTRLVPVDLLPVELSNIPRRVDTDEGMIVLPVPRQPGPDGQLADIQLETQPVVTPPSSPNGVAGDNIQSRIDSIVNASPGPSSGALVLSTRGFDGTTPTRALTQHGHGAGAGGSARREKIYCDKWIHDGTCAFTQQGCKYKHEMPHDRETQEKLGLFHGYPGWWKKQAVEQQRPLAIDDRPVSLSAGRAGFGSLGASTSMGSGLSTAVVSSNWRAGPGPVGDTGVNGSPASASPASGNGSIVGRGGTIGFGGTGRGNARQPRTFASFQPPAATYGPIGPPSRAGASGSGSASLSGSAAAPVTTRGTRALTASSAASNGTNDDIRGGGGHQQRSALDSTNPFAPLGDLNQPSARAARARRDEHSSNDTTADADEEQRGAPL